MSFQGTPDSSYGLPATPQWLDPKWLRKIVQIYTGVDPGLNSPGIDLNQLLNIRGIQPVAFVTLKNQAIRAYNPGFARLVSGGTAIEQNEDSTLVQTYVNATIIRQNDGATVYTVTTGKTFYCTGIAVSSEAAAAALMIIQVGGSTVLEHFIPTKDAKWFTSMPAPLFSGTSGQTITISGAGAALNTCSIFGWEE